MYPDQPTRVGSDGKKYRICPLCNRDERTGGAWVDTKNPCFFRDRDLTIRVKKGELEGHALCMLLNNRPTRSHKYGGSRQNYTKESIR